MIDYKPTAQEMIADAKKAGMDILGVDSYRRNERERSVCEQSKPGVFELTEEMMEIPEDYACDLHREYREMVRERQEEAWFPDED